ncbi:MAG: tRNA epoxyqueuosine(34) reductase QueG [Bacteroidetes bacterium]|nr:tRNA epoxyqueuosine(34) reductase QueG [Bacteroidota bacterium]
MNISHNTYLIRTEAKRLGFDYIGFSKAAFLEEEAPRLENWLNNNMHGQMSYMSNYFDKRLDPRLLVPGARSVVSLLLNYFPSEVQEDESAPKISKYAYGKDYHLVIKDKLNQLLEFIKENIGEVDGRAFTDSAPVLDKAWAKKSGLGWIGKHSNLINKSSGSFHFIAELIIDLELEYDGAIKDYCGTCTKCMDACPTEAITAPHIVNGSKCISYFTIELKENIPNELKGKFNDWVFGCDICQDVCPWNRFSQPHSEPHFQASAELIEMKRQDWYEITEETFRRVFKDSAVKRTKFAGLKRNIEFIKT